MITTLKDVKDVLNKVPDELLDKLWFGLGEGAEEDIQLIACEDWGGMNAKEEEGYPEIFETIDKKYPDVNELVKFIKNIGKAQGILDEQGDNAEKLSERLYENGDELTSNFFDEDNK